MNDEARGRSDDTALALNCTQKGSISVCDLLERASEMGCCASKAEAGQDARSGKEQRSLQTDDGDTPAILDGLASPRPAEAAPAVRGNMNGPTSDVMALLSLPKGLRSLDPGLDGIQGLLRDEEEGPTTVRDSRHGVHGHEPH